MHIENLDTVNNLNSITECDLLCNRDLKSTSCSRHVDSWKIVESTRHIYSFTKVFIGGRVVSCTQTWRSQQ